MRPLSFHRHAANYLKRMPADRKSQVLDAVKSLCPMENPGEHPHVKAMQGEWSNLWRLRVGALWVIFRITSLPEGGETIDVLQVGPRGDIYK